MNSALLQKLRQIAPVFGDALPFLAAIVIGRGVFAGGVGAHHEGIVACLKRVCKLGVHLGGSWRIRPSTIT